MKNDFVLWARQYSKRLITFLLIAWSVGGVIGIVYEFLRLFNSPDVATMDSLYIYLAIPLTCGIPSYIIPNMFLNKEKVKQNYIPDYDQTILGGEYQNEDGIGDSSGETEEGRAEGLYADTEAYPTQQRD